MYLLQRIKDWFGADAAADFRVTVQRGGETLHLGPRELPKFRFMDGDGIRVDGDHPVTWGDTIVPIGQGRSMRLPAEYKEAKFKGFRIPHHLVTLTGAGPETLDSFGQAHIEKYTKYVGLAPDMHIMDVGCGIGRDAFQLMDWLTPAGRYTGVDVTWDSIDWCSRHITPRHPNFRFFHANAFSELYNPFGIQGLRYRLPADDGSVDRIVLASVFTHLLEDEVLHYMREFRRILKPDGRVYASFFLYTPEALEAARTKRNTAWEATFAQALGDGVYGNDPAYPRGAVAYTDAAMQRMMRAAGLELARPYLKGWWSGLHGDAAEDGQDAAILKLAA